MSGKTFAGADGETAAPDGHSVGLGVSEHEWNRTAADFESGREGAANLELDGDDLIAPGGDGRSWRQGHPDCHFT